MDRKTEQGPQVDNDQFNKVLSYVESGKQEGAKLMCGGERVGERGYFVAPTVFADVKDDMKIAQEEIFGPVISAMPFNDIDEVIARANRTPFGLGSGIWTRDVSKAHRLAHAVRAGSVWVNCYQAMDPAVPFGGYKLSGYGRESGIQQLDEYLNVKAVWIKTD
jgi:aldehyde dehydrogenase (NAD+)